MASRDELIEKMVAGTLGRDEALELRDILHKEDRESKLRLLAAMGVGAAAAITLPPLLEMELGDLLDLRMEPRVLEVQPQKPAPPAALRPGADGPATVRAGDPPPPAAGPGGSAPPVRRVRPQRQ